MVMLSVISRTRRDDGQGDEGGCVNAEPDGHQLPDGLSRRRLDAQIPHVTSQPKGDDCRLVALLYRRCWSPAHGVRMGSRRGLVSHAQVRLPIPIVRHRAAVRSSGILPGVTADQGPRPSPPKKRARRLMPSLWAGLVPNGMDQQKPKHFCEMARIVWDNRRHPNYAWDVLTKGVCDGCALGVAGLHDWTIDGVHLCTTRLEPAPGQHHGRHGPERLADVEPLRERDGAELRPSRSARLPDAAALGRARVHPHLAGTRRSPSRAAHIAPRRRTASPST